MNHLKNAVHWHLPLVALALILCAGSFLAGYSAAHTEKFKGGYIPGLLPKPITILGGAPLPGYWSLERYVVRVHNQDSSNSCVGQTGSTITEIVQKEHTGRSIPMSTGYLYNQINGGVDQGANYNDLFNLMTDQGDSSLAAFAPDGYSDQFVQPGDAARANARLHHLSGWRSIDPADQHTIRSEIHAGRPIAIAMPIYESFYDHFGDGSEISQAYGAILFSHSMTIIGYRSDAVLILNSWGPGWGIDGKAWVSWDFIAGVGSSLVISTEHFVPKPKPKPFPRNLWDAYRLGHHLKPISAYYHGKLSWAASIWRHRPKTLHGIKDHQRWYPAKGKHGLGFTKTPFARGVIYTWPARKTYKVTS